MIVINQGTLWMWSQCHSLVRVFTFCKVYHAFVMQTCLQIMQFYLQLVAVLWLFHCFIDIRTDVNLATMQSQARAWIVKGAWTVFTHPRAVHSDGGSKLMHYNTIIVTNTIVNILIRKVFLGYITYDSKSHWNLLTVSNRLAYMYEHGPGSRGRFFS